MNYVLPSVPKQPLGLLPGALKASYSVCVSWSPFLFNGLSGLLPWSTTSLGVLGQGTAGGQGEVSTFQELPELPPGLSSLPK